MGQSPAAWHWRGSRSFAQPHRRGAACRGIRFFPSAFPLAAAATLVMTAIWFAVASVARGDDVSRAASDLFTKYAAEIEELAAWCDQQGLAKEARRTRAWVRHRDPNKLYIAVLPQAIGQPELPADTPENVTEWQDRFWTLRRQQAAALESLARKAVRGGQASLGFDLVLSAIRENPDHEELRRLLGYQKFQGAWHTAYEIEKLKSGKVWNDKFAWIRKEHVGRYQNGQRLAGNKWITAAEDAKRHPDTSNGWFVETEHYTIRTGVSIEAGAALGMKLENLFRVWRQLFFRYFATDAQVSELFEKRGRIRLPSPRFLVTYFRDREEYIASLRSRFDAGFEKTTGVYEPQTRTAYFFAGDYDDRNLYHEATHQLFHQSRPVALQPGSPSNFWIIEGIAMYMESLHEENGFSVLGGFGDLRMNDARVRLLRDDFYIPLADLTTFGQVKLQQDKRISTIYSQSAGLTHFLIHYDHGRYRNALVAYLLSVYTGRDSPDTLAKLTGVSLSKLDKQYHQFVSGQE